jgi:hypothetical protein
MRRRVTVRAEGVNGELAPPNPVSGASLREGNRVPNTDDFDCQFKVADGLWGVGW